MYLLADPTPTLLGFCAPFGEAPSDPNPRTIKIRNLHLQNRISSIKQPSNTIKLLHFFNIPNHPHHPQHPQHLPNKLPWDPLTVTASKPRQPADESRRLALAVPQTPELRQTTGLLEDALRGEIEGLGEDEDEMLGGEMHVCLRLSKETCVYIYIIYELLL